MVNVYKFVINIKIFIIKYVCFFSPINKIKYEIFFKNLGDVLELIINKNLNKLLRILLLSPVERDCFELRRVLKNVNIDYNILAEIFFTRSNKHIQTIKDTYQKCKNKTSLFLIIQQTFHFSFQYLRLHLKKILLVMKIIL